MRLVIEIIFFGFAALILYQIEMTTPAIAITVITCAHYIADRDRVKWLLQASFKERDLTSEDQ